MEIDRWKNVPFCISLLISNFFFLNREILFKPISDFLILVFLEQFSILRFEIAYFSILPMPDELY